MTTSRAALRRRWAFAVGIVVGAVGALIGLSRSPDAVVARVTTALRPARMAAYETVRAAALAAARAVPHAAGAAVALVRPPVAIAERLVHALKPVKPLVPEVTPAGKPDAITPAACALPTARATPSFEWPVAGEVSSCYGERWGRIHVGVDIAAPDGAPVLASRAGRVVYSGSLPGYGNLILIEHEGGWFTVYGHNQRHLVEATGDGRAMVRAGQAIALVGHTGNATGPHVHFEIRKSIDAVDPLQVLPRACETARVP